ncbi:hypothetical protein CEP54_003139 [Fusarium duplospermum]|uniref:Uncharacterized protein n=1 Tax=Fusarium duplospermum TaxID=1325734 RepID=A0A428QR50_9HYPO|nr:hypothetical protein CEP54_003139 [Fusarium duplospermum]
MHLISAVHFYARQQHLAAPPYYVVGRLILQALPSLVLSCPPGSVTSQTETVPPGTQQLVVDETFTKKPLLPCLTAPNEYLAGTGWHCPAAGPGSSSILC